MITHSVKGEAGNLQYLTFPEFDSSGLVKHCFTTRHGGVSGGCFSSLNMRFGQDEYEAVFQNYKILCKELDIEIDNLVFSKQVHEDNILVATKRDAGKSMSERLAASGGGYDGMITNDKNVCLVTFYADCVPLLFLDPVKKVIGAAHAGWRGTVKKIGKKTVLKMMEVYGCRPSDILAGIAPSIGVCCFEVGNDCAKEFLQLENSEQFVLYKNEKYNVDLWKANELILREAGVKKIYLANECTKCNNKKYYSHRYMGSNRGSLAALIQLND